MLNILVIVSSIQLTVAFYKLICWVLHSLLHMENIYSQYLHDFKVLKASICITWWEPHSDPRRQSSYDYRSPLNVIYGQRLELREAEWWPGDTQPRANQSEQGPRVMFSFSCSQAFNGHFCWALYSPQTARTGRTTTEMWAFWLGIS